MLSHHKYFHWLYHHGNKKALFNLVTGLFIWFFLAFARPFGISINNVSLFELIGLMLPVGLLWILIVYTLDFLIIRWLGIPIHQNVKSDLITWGIKIFLYIHVIWIVRGFACGWSCLDAFEYLELWVGITVLIGLVYIPYSLYARSQYFHKAISDGDDENVIVVKGEGNDFVKIHPSEVIYIKADDNYSDFILSTGEKVTLRSSLTSAYKQLIQHTQFIRTHRSYIINAQSFHSYKRTKSNIVLKHKDELIEVPVSRSYKEEIDKYFTRPK